MNIGTGVSRGIPQPTPRRGKKFPAANRLRISIGYPLDTIRQRPFYSGYLSDIRRIPDDGFRCLGFNRVPDEVCAICGYTPAWPGTRDIKANIH